MRHLIFFLTILFAISAHDAAAEIVGRASVIDGDTIEIRNQRICLHGIDSPESAQLCQSEQKCIAVASKRRWRSLTGSVSRRFAARSGGWIATAGS